MSRKKNALRGHFVAEFYPERPYDEPTEWLELAKWVSEIEDDTDEEIDDTGFYDGDGSPENTVTSIAETWKVSGFYDKEDPAQALIFSKKRKIGDGRKLWHKIVDSSVEKQYVGVATATEIKAGTGEATEFEGFECSLIYNQVPVESDVTPEA